MSEKVRKGPQGQVTSHARHEKHQGVCLVRPCGGWRCSPRAEDRGWGNRKRLVLDVQVLDGLQTFTEKVQSRVSRLLLERTKQ